MMLELPCDCQVEMTHDHADRRVECACRRVWVVRGHKVINITYEVREIDKVREAV